MHTLPLYYFAISLATDAIYSAAGGYACARVAASNQGKHVLALIVAGELVGVAGTFALWTTVPHFYSFALLALYPSAVWFGGKLRKQVRAQAAGLG